MTVATYTGNKRYGLMELLEPLCRRSSGENRFGLTLECMILEARKEIPDVREEEMADALVNLKTVKRTSLGTYFYLPRLKRVPPKERKTLFYSK